MINNQSIKLLFISNIENKHAIVLKHELNMQLTTDELKNILKNDISFAKPPSPIKMSLLIIHSKFEFCRFF